MWVVANCSFAPCAFVLILIRNFASLSETLCQNWSIWVTAIASLSTVSFPAVSQCEVQESIVVQ